ncbi:MAG: hypothetical protein ACPLXS_03620, partial [Candidatus Micrarchaeales archaeon]
GKENELIPTKDSQLFLVSLSINSLEIIKMLKKNQNLFSFTFVDELLKTKRYYGKTLDVEYFANVNTPDTLSLLIEKQREQRNKIKI